ncbi:MAG TPA: hypothetical protein VFQ61_16720 [Polyangiaceae bacterium]|nr:hypothetical protein [Polyangiaceae bacterium]
MPKDLQHHHPLVVGLRQLRSWSTPSALACAALLGCSSTESGSAGSGGKAGQGGAATTGGATLATGGTGTSAGAPGTGAGGAGAGGTTSGNSSGGVSFGGSSSGGASSIGGTGVTTGGSSNAAGNAGATGGVNADGGTSGAAGTNTAGNNNGGSATGGTLSGGSGGQSGGGTAGQMAGGAGAGGQTSGGDIPKYFSSLPCGAKYTALGDGGWRFCVRLEDGGGACANRNEVFERITFSGGGAITNVAQVSGYGDGPVAVVTTAGALHTGSSATSINTTPVIASGVVNFSGGLHSRVALVRQGQGFSVVGWTENGSPAPIALPSGVQPVQVSGNYGLACALATTGDVYCWEAGGNHSLGFTTTPSKAQLGKPVKLISVGQNTVCGVSFDNTLECQVAWYDSPWVPTEGSAPNFKVRQTTFPSIAEVHAGYHQGIIVRSDGAAFFLEGNSPGMDNPGKQFTGATNVVAAGGDRGNACVQAGDGSVYCFVNGAVKQATLSGAPLKVKAATCP